MSNPANTADTQKEQGTDTKQSEPTFAERVNDTASKMVKDEKGNWTLPDGEEISEEVKVAAVAEKRYRDTQASYTKSRQELKALEAEKSVLLKKAIGNVKLNLTPEQTEELDELKFEDPEAWRRKLNAYERDAFKKHEEELTEEVKKVSTSSLESEELEQRKVTLAAFLEQKNDPEFNAETIEYDIPPRIKKRLEDHKVTFEEFLEECYQYAKTGKVVKQTEKTLDQPNLGKAGGANAPGKNAVNKDVIESYHSETY